EEDGATHELRIEIPSGRYAPLFVLNAPKVEAIPESWPAPRPPAPPPSAKWRLIWLGATAVLIAGMAGARYLPQRGPRLAITPIAAAAPRISPLPAVGAAGNAIRIMAGSSVGSYTDSSGAVWGGDRYFTGGTA